MRGRPINRTLRGHQQECAEAGRAAQRRPCSLALLRPERSTLPISQPIAEALAPWQDILDLAYYSGWRKHEILGLTLRATVRPVTPTGSLRPCVHSSAEVLLLGAPPVVDAGVVVPAVEPERPELAVAIAVALEGPGVLVRVGVEDVLGAD